ncbi:hypothetical protein L596_002342 [Steinernema carpocapsae]|uniref:Uncharacterized protein n=1 Tax=Steinernema carpocapsae TaxID=34508 RepID=A0A4U8USX1_STECR|nr:hypothetical protein L596_002342 [Steinernema carpocapsae]
MDGQRSLRPSLQLLFRQRTVSSLRTILLSSALPFSNNKIRSIRSRLSTSSIRSPMDTTTLHQLRRPPPSTGVTVPELPMAHPVSSRLLPESRTRLRCSQMEHSLSSNRSPPLSPSSPSLLISTPSETTMNTNGASLVR